MKKVVCICLAIVLLAVAIIGVFHVRHEKVPLSLGWYSSKEFYSNGSSQDFTDYAKYHYHRVRAERSKYFSPVTDDDIALIKKHLDSFEGWVNAAGADSDLMSHYDFDRSVIDTEDYVFIDDEFYQYTNVFGDTVVTDDWSRYDMYFLDWQTKTLYYFHNNI